MNQHKELKKLRKKAERLQLDNAAILRKYNMQQLCAIYNGIGPDSFPIGCVSVFLLCIHLLLPWR